MMSFKKSIVIALSLLVVTAQVNAAAAAAGNGNFLVALRKSVLRAIVKNAVGPDAVAALSHVESSLIEKYLEAEAALATAQAQRAAGDSGAVAAVTAAMAIRDAATGAVIQATRAAVQAQRAADGSGAVGAAAALNHVEPPTATTAAARAVEARTAATTAATRAAVRIEGPAGVDAFAVAMALSRTADNAEQDARILSRSAVAVAAVAPAPAPVATLAAGSPHLRAVATPGAVEASMARYDAEKIAVIQATRAAGGSGAVGAAAALNHVEPPTATTAAARAVEARTAATTAATRAAVRIEGPAGPDALAAAMALSRRADNAEQAARTLSRRADEAERAITPPAPAAHLAAVAAAPAPAPVAAPAPALSRAAAPVAAIAAAPAPQAPSPVVNQNPPPRVAGAHGATGFFALCAGIKNHKVTSGAASLTTLAAAAVIGRLEYMFNAAPQSVKKAGRKAFYKAELTKALTLNAQADTYVTSGIILGGLTGLVTLGAILKK